MKKALLFLSIFPASVVTGCTNAQKSSAPLKILVKLL